MPDNLIIKFANPSFIDDVVVCSLDVKEGVTFLVSFENEMDMNEFTEICKESGDTWIESGDTWMIVLPTIY